MNELAPGFNEHATAHAAAFFIINGCGALFFVASKLLYIAYHY